MKEICILPKDFTLTLSRALPRALSRALPKILLLAIFILGLSSCGGDGNGGSFTPPSFRVWQEGVFFNAANYSNQCAVPRSGADPLSGRPVPDRQGRFVDENNWLRSIHREFYLWYDEIDDLDPSLFATPEYFDLQRTTQASSTGSGKDKDNYHYSVDPQVFADVITDGAYIGYGAKFIVQSDAPSREVVVAFTEPDSPAVDTLVRGTRVISVDGESVSTGNVAIINAGLFPSTIGESHDFIIRDANGMDSTLSLTSELVTSEPVKHAGVLAGTNNVGYILFNAHVAPAEQQLINAITLLGGTSVTDLILDLRYNSGGALHFASELSYMMASNTVEGDPDEENVLFETLQLNDQFQEPETMPYYTTERGINNNPSDNDLPTLSVSNLVVLTSNITCGASESIINNLRSFTDLNVFVVGSATCGNPYGSLLFTNCGNVYVITSTEGSNALEVGGADLSDGLVPENISTPGAPEAVPGCALADDFDNGFDSTQANISVALDILADPDNFDPLTDCPTPATPVPSYSDGLELKLVL